MPFTIRPIQPHEHARFRAIRLRSLASDPTAFASTLAETKARPGTYWRDRLTAADGKESVLFVAQDGEEWIGLVGGYVFEEDDERVPYLISMWVDPAHRGHGVGEALVLRVVDWARDRGFDHLLLEVESTNQPAISLYARCGFQRVGMERPHPTYAGLKEIMMEIFFRPRE